MRRDGHEQGESAPERVTRHTLAYRCV
jgi:hypothetical protein